MPAQDFSSITPNPNIGVVLQGFDMHINYKKYCVCWFVTYISISEIFKSDAESIQLFEPKQRLPPGPHKRR